MKLLQYYCCPVNTENSLFDGSLYSYMSHYRNPTEKTRISMCKRTRISRILRISQTHTVWIFLNQRRITRIFTIRMILTCATFGSYAISKEYPQVDLRDLWFVLFVKFVFSKIKRLILPKSNTSIFFTASVSIFGCD